MNTTVTFCRILSKENNQSVSATRREYKAPKSTNVIIKGCLNPNIQFQQMAIL